MSTRDLLAQALAAMLAHRLRATLSALGIVIGVATVVAALAIGEGARREALAEVSGLGIDNVLVRAVREAGAGDTRSQPAAPALTVGDLEALESAAHEIVAATALRKTTVELRSGSRLVVIHAVGCTERWNAVAGLRVADGRWLQAADVRSGRRVAVIGSDVARSMFDGADPLSRLIPLSGNWYRVVGVLADDAQTVSRRRAVQTLDMRRAVIVPLTTMDVSLGAGDRIDRVAEIVLRTSGAEAVERVAQIVSRTMRRRHPSGSGYEIVVPREILQARLRTQRTFDLVLAAIGLLALTISGVGIMNIMLASVAERTAEVGVRRAFGARRRDVTLQFALEASLLCAAGGLAGLAFGVVLSAAVAAAAGWPVAISWTGAAAALALAAATGLLFGTYPARRAALLDPVEALRQ